MEVDRSWWASWTSNPVAGRRCPWWVRFPCTSARVVNLFFKEEKMFGIGMPELLVILVIVLVIFGANKLPQIGEGLGKGIRNFKKSTKEAEEIDVTPKKAEEKKPD